MKTEQGIQHLKFKIQNNNKVTYWKSCNKKSKKKLKLTGN